MSSFSGQSPNSSSGPPLLKGELNFKPAMFFLDTGSMVCMMSYVTLQDFGLNPVIHRTNTLIQGVTGNAMSVMGEAIVNLAWDGIVFPQEILIINGAHHTPGHVLLGHNFLARANVWLNPQSNVMVFNNKQFQLCPYGPAWGHKDLFHPDLVKVDSSYHPMLGSNIPSSALNAMYVQPSPPPPPSTMHPGNPFVCGDTLAAGNDASVNVSHTSGSAPPNISHPPEVNCRNELQVAENTDFDTDVLVSSDSLPFPIIDKDELSIVNSAIEVDKAWKYDDSPHFVCIDTVTLQPFATVLVNVSTVVANDGVVLVLPEYCTSNCICVFPALYKLNKGKSQIHVINMTPKKLDLNSGTRITNLEHTKLEIKEFDLPDPVFCGAGSAASEGPSALQEALKKALKTPPQFIEGQEILNNLFVQYPNILPSEGRPLGRTSYLEHSITLTQDAKPVCIPSYRIPHSRRRVLESEVQGMLETGLIEPSNSPWSSPMLLVPKSDKTFRPVVDYRGLNKVTVPEPYPMPNLRALLQDIRTNSKIFSSIDLAKGFLQVPLEKSSRPLTAFSTHMGHFQFKVAPMGLRNSPLTFCRLMNIVLQGLLHDNVLVYLDDILICTETVKDHEAKLRKVFQRLDSAGLTINPAKCQFFQKELIFLGHTISESGILPNDAKIKAVKAYPTPKNPKDIKAFLGLAGFYRCFVYKYGEIAAPLTNLLKKTVTWKWGEEEENAFQKLKTKLVTAPVLIFPDYTLPFHLYTDASNFGLGAALMQNITGKLQPIAFASRLMNAAERKYNTTDREMLGIIFALRHFKEIILGYRVIVHTDHRSLTPALTGKDPYGRKARYQLTLGEFDCEFTYVRGKENAPPDALSRASLPALMSSDDIAQSDPDTFPPSHAHVSGPRMPHVPAHDVGVCGDPSAAQVHAICPIAGSPLAALSHDDIMTAQSKDQAYSDIIRALQTNSVPPKKKGLPVEEFFLENGLLYRKSVPKRIRGRTGISRKVLVIPEEFIETLLKFGHEGNGHVGLHKTIRFLREKYFFPKLVQRVTRYVRACKTCPLFKGHTSSPAPILTYDIPHKPWHRVFCDTLTFPSSSHGNKYLVVFVDQFSRFCELVIVPDKSANAVAKAFFDAIICRHGTPSYLVHDNGTEFSNAILKELCTRLNVKQVNVLPYRPQANGITERLNRTIIEIIKPLAYAGKDNWCELIPSVQSAINGTYHSSLGDTPDFLMNGQDKRMPYDLIEENLKPLYSDNYAEQLARELQSAWKCTQVRLAKSQDKMISQQHRGSRVKNIKVGSIVFHEIVKQGTIRNKLAPKFEGPLRVLEVKRQKCRCRCLKTMKEIWYHFDTLKLASEFYKD